MELDGFFKDQAQAGENKGEGEFSIAREQALKMLSRFQLPYAGAWAIKVIQAAVRSGAKDPILITRGKGSVFFKYRPVHSPTLDMIESAFFNPDPELNPTVDHLKRALWTQGLQKKRSFALRLPHCKEALVWDGQEFSRTDREETEHFELALNFGRDYRLEVESLGKALRQYAFTSPVPIFWDEERIDGLQLCPEHGVRAAGAPLLLTFSSAGLHRWPVPLGTFAPTEDFVEILGDEWQRLLSTGALHVIQPDENETVFAHLLHYGVQYDELLSRWKTTESRSACYWVQDGVLVDRDLIGQPSPFSLAVFASAQGLETDLTTLQLRDTPERQSRLNQTLAALPRREFEVLRAESFYSVGLNRSKARRRSGGAMMLCGVLGAPLSLGLSLVLTLAGWHKHRQCEKEAQEFDQTLNRNLKDFISQWPASTPAE